MTLIGIIDSADLNLLRSVWHLSTLKIGQTDGRLWMKGIPSSQLPIELAGLPNFKLYYLKGEKIIPHGKLLPVARLPKELQFVPIQQLITIEVDNFNHNYFGLSDSVSLELVPSQQERTVTGLLAPLSEENTSTIVNAASFRLQHLSYTIINQQQLFILGNPTLPLIGQSYWNDGPNYYPTGMAPALFLLVPVLRKKLNLQSEDILLWYKDNSYDVIAQSSFGDLSRSSYRKYLKRTE